MTKKDLDDLGNDLTDKKVKKGTNRLTEGQSGVYSRMQATRKIQRQKKIDDFFGQSIPGSFMISRSLAEKQSMEKKYCFSQ